MPLLDHFRGPLATHRHWTSFHNAWATYLSEDLNDRLLPGYFAEPNVHFDIEIDVAPQRTVPFMLATDVVEVLIYHRAGGPTLAGAIELVSPANKDRPTSRDAFVNKCASYLHQGVGLVIVDAVTDRQANLHQQLLTRLSCPVGNDEADLYAAAYHPIQRAGQTALELWFEPLSLGLTLPTLPLWLRGGMGMPVFLEDTYEKTVVKQRVLRNGG